MVVSRLLIMAELNPKLLLSKKEDKKRMTGNEMWSSRTEMAVMIVKKKMEEDVELEAMFTLKNLKVSFLLSIPNY
ncbi:hypothetical protein SLA2020_326480 [Shorea laevis]